MINKERLKNLLLKNGILEEDISINYGKLLNGYKIIVLGNHDPKPDSKFWLDGGWNVINGCFYEDPNTRFIYKLENADYNDELLSSIIIDIDGKTLGFSHYCVGIDDNYDHKNIKIPARKKVLESLFDSHCVDINVHGHLHSKTVDSDKHINVSCEQIDYTPVRLKDIL